MLQCNDKDGGPISSEEQSIEDIKRELEDIKHKLEAMRDSRDNKGKIIKDFLGCLRSYTTSPIKPNLIAEFMRGDDIDWKDIKKELKYALQQACDVKEDPEYREGRVPAVEWLLDQKLADVKMVDNKGRSLLKLLIESTIGHLININHLSNDDEKEKQIELKDVEELLSGNFTPLGQLLRQRGLQLSATSIKELCSKIDGTSSAASRKVPTLYKSVVELMLQAGAKRKDFKQKFEWETNQPPGGPALPDDKKTKADIKTKFDKLKKDAKTNDSKDAIVKFFRESAGLMFSDLFLKVPSAPSYVEVTPQVLQDIFVRAFDLDRIALYTDDERAAAQWLLDQKLADVNAPNSRGEVAVEVFLTSTIAQIKTKKQHHSRVGIVVLLTSSLPTYFDPLKKILTKGKVQSLSKEKIKAIIRKIETKEEYKGGRIIYQTPVHYRPVVEFLLQVGAER